ncbi:DUF2490 domain-containing protein [Flagellimonas marinaquae]|uniref:DUF2490 domain-containing protein n=1 Tax=Flagellimonas aurea TaxID=2915619 RepID=A0ABS3G3V6_9FLAO|nr:DUF2490 domain-containing protein [Allomuricauda aurea]MBO0354104.1 DUF2490 domain-containing protein [Allomuricauda aurea]UBZ14247.1 DUF2490 domain-containing protein [Allomuricauda aquimarina]
MIKRLTGLFLFLGILTINAQQPGEDEMGAWYMYFGTNKISERLSIHTEAQFRFYETTSNFNQMLLRTGLNYHIDPNAIATGGYAFIDTDNNFYEFEGEVNSKEHRIFEQFILKNKVWEFLFEHRYRLEQRFLDFGETTDTQHRARYRIQMTLPLTNTFFLNFYDELFINLQDDLFGQNRLYGAVGLNVTENMSIQLGYMRNQFANAVYDRLQLAVFYNPDLRGLFKGKKTDQ